MPEISLDFNDSCVLFRAERTHQMLLGETPEPMTEMPGFDSELQVTILEGARADVAREDLEVDARERLKEYGSIALLHQEAINTGANQDEVDKLQLQMDLKLNESINSLRISAEIAVQLGKQAVQAH